MWQTIEIPDKSGATDKFKFGQWFDFKGDHLLVGTANRASLTGKCSYLFKLEGDEWKLHYSTRRSVVPSPTARGTVNMYGSPFVALSGDNYMVTCGDTSDVVGKKAIDIWEIRK